MNWHTLFETKAPAWSVLIRLQVGLMVFLPEGIQKLIFPDILGAGRFARIGIPFFPTSWAPSSGLSKWFAASSSSSACLRDYPRFR
jgi:hypothetical protein